VKTKMKKILLGLIFMMLAVAACTSSSEITNFEECEAAGNPIMESYPRQCAANGETFTEEIDAIECDDETMTYCPSLGECVRVFQTECAEYQEYYKEPSICTREYMPVCGSVNIPSSEGVETMRVTFGNSCEANAVDATEITQGMCDDSNENINKFDSCLAAGGNALPEFNECEHVSQEICDGIGGEFFGCESACRNDPNAQFCTLQCVQVCKFN
jgi:hypothetical protein